jgi:hypothetical protein
MTEDEKRRVIADLLARAETAERRGLPHTGKGWRDHAEALKFRPASEIIFARPIGEFDISGRTNKAGIVAMTVTAAKAVASATTAAIESAIRPQLDPTAA